MSLRHAVLGLLIPGPASGYDLLRVFRTSLAHVWQAPQSQIYGELNRLAADGLLQVSERGPRGRKLYSLADAGRAEFDAWVTNPDIPEHRRNELLLHVFFLGFVPPDRAAAYLTAQAAHARAMHAGLRQLQATQDWDDGPLASQGRLALEYGLRITTTQVEWAEWAAEQIRQARAGTGQVADT